MRYQNYFKRFGMNEVLTLSWNCHEEAQNRGCLELREI